MDKYSINYKYSISSGKYYTFKMVDGFGYTSVEISFQEWKNLTNRNPLEGENVFDVL